MRNSSVRYGMRRKWRYKRQLPPRQLPRPSRPVWIAALVLLGGIAVWVAGLSWGVLPVVLGLVGLLLAGMWGVRKTRGVDPDDARQYGGGSHNLVEVEHPPSSPD
jgi:cytoskeletal protein RodZ